MTAKVEYKKELYSLPSDIVETLKKYAQETHKKKSHIVAEAIADYIDKNRRKQLAQVFKHKKLKRCLASSTQILQIFK